MKEQINQLRHQFQTDLSKAGSSDEIQQLEVKYLGRKGPLQELMAALRNLSPEEKAIQGKELNLLKGELTDTLTENKEKFLLAEESLRLKEEKIDVSLPGRQHHVGRKHPLIQTLDRIIDIMSGMGFTVVYGPDIDNDYYNFEGLNFPLDHPARDMQDTFYVNPHVMLRTQTSNVQIRVMEGNKPPIRIIAPGTAYRNESVTARSHVFFHQVEAFYVNKGVTFSELLMTLEEFLAKFFNRKVKTRFRPSYFPFVEPGLEVDVECILCQGEGCSLCKHTGWLEIAGAGMVHPEVLKNGGIDPEVYSGYAWGMGIERLVMLLHGVKDIRLFSENDLRFLKQFVGN